MNMQQDRIMNIAENLSQEETAEVAGVMLATYCPIQRDLIEIFLAQLDDVQKEEFAGHVARLTDEA